MPDIFISGKDIKPPANLPLNEDRPALLNKPLSPKEKLHTEIDQKKSIGNALTAFAAYPEGVRFETQEEKEEIILLLRKHIITNLFWVVAGIIFVGIGPFIFPWLHFLFKLNIPFNFQFIGMLIWYTFSASFIFINFLSWYYNVYIVTNERIVDVDFYNITYKQIASAPLTKVQDVTIKSGGVIRTIFDFADVLIQTAGEEENIHFEAIPKPDLVARQILELVEKYNNPV